eukprot:TRINITY_DN49975_c0_g1_i1.p1 TRINITY_DN49975_c0_g1~~TRINITY_DN49975_c0_g1_i1.p1  ORF type:complete len:258 (+),score=36.35 TRINITY_DN49975_c0_g1_i1:68-841(+)
MRLARPRHVLLQLTLLLGPLASVVQATLRVRSAKGSFWPLDGIFGLNGKLVKENVLEVVNISTSLGTLAVWEFGSSVVERPAVLALHGAGNSDEIHQEWFRVAVRLAKDGFNVLVPNMHSCSACAPGRVSAGDREQQLLEILQHTGRESFAALLGKSHGGAIAANFAAAQPSKVVKLVLVAPALARQDLKIGQEAMLLWAKDDPVVPFSRAMNVAKCLVNKTEHHYVVETGGHKVLDSYTGEIAGFLEDRPDAQHRC